MWEYNEEDNDYLNANLIGNPNKKDKSKLW